MVLIYANHMPDLVSLALPTLNFYAANFLMIIGGARCKDAAALDSALDH